MLKNKKSKNLKLQTKICLTCKREFQNRKSWEIRGQWEEVRYCSKSCAKFKDNVIYINKFKK